jgi:hypothetical protein
MKACIIWRSERLRVEAEFHQHYVLLKFVHKACNTTGLFPSPLWVGGRCNSHLTCDYNDPQATPIPIAAARYLAAHAPTRRTRHQTAQVAQRLMRGGALHEDAGEAEDAAPLTRPSA